MPAKQSVFQGKSVIFVTSIPIPEAPMGRGWADIHMVKGVFVRFGFDAIRISQIQRQVKNKATKNVSGGVLYTALIGFGRFCRSLSECILYTYTGVGLSALLVSTNWAMPEPLHVERVTEQAPRFFVCISE